MSVVAASRPVVLRPMTEADIVSVSAIDDLVYERPRSVDLLRGQVPGSDNRFHLVAQSDGEVVGHAGLLVVADEGHVTTVAVHPDVQGGGVGACLLAGLCRAAVAAGLASMTLEVRVSNEAAIGLYRRFGFAPAGVRPRYYADGDEDALIMWLHDIGDPAFRERVEASCAADPVNRGGDTGG